MTQELFAKATFEGKEIRKTFHENEWWFSVIDIISVLTNSDKPKDYWYRMKAREKKEAELELSGVTKQLKLPSIDGRYRKTDCANIEGMFRIIQSIPSPKAEPFKKWLAKLGRERLEEIENPHLGMERARKLYQSKGYPDEWIDKRLQSVSVRKNLTKEWQDRGAQEGMDFAILTNEIMNNAFDLTVGEYKDHKGIRKEPLRDHMNELELIITMLSEATTTRITKTRDSEGMEELKSDAKEGGTVAGNARKEIEQRTSKRVISKDNYLELPKKKQLENT